MERTTMSQKEFARGAVFERVVAGQLTLTEAAPLLDLSYRQVKRLYGRYRSEGASGLVHRTVGRASNHARSAVERERVLTLVRELYGGTAERGPAQRFGPALAAEHLWTDHGLKVPCSTLRDWMRSAGLWSRVRRVRPKTQRRERRHHFGELVQLDGSFHDWFEGRGERAGRRSCVMNMVDDATGTTLLRFSDHETTWAAADVLQAWIECYGVPRALYTDWNTVYKHAPTDTERACGERRQTQFGRMCGRLGIEIIAAATPQAKGRVERNNGTQQDRLIKKLRLQGICDDAAANEYVQSAYLPQHNARFAVAATSPVDYHLPRAPQPSDRDVFCLEHTRTVSNDFVVQFEKQAMQLDRSARGRVPAGSRIIVREHRDGPLRVIHLGRGGIERECLWLPAVAAPKRQVPTAQASQPKPRPRPAADHPWRRAAALTSRKPAYSTP